MEIDLTGVKSSLSSWYDEYGHQLSDEVIGVITTNRSYVIKQEVDSDEHASHLKHRLEMWRRNNAKYISEGTAVMVIITKSDYWVEQTRPDKEDI